jgi:hypothetical protein
MYGECADQYRNRLSRRPCVTTSANPDFALAVRRWRRLLRLWSGWWTWDRRNHLTYLDRPAPYRTLVDSIACTSGRISPPIVSVRRWSGAVSRGGPRPYSSARAVHNIAKARRLFRAINALALTLLAHPHVAVYDGSMSEWATSRAPAHGRRQPRLRWRRASSPHIWSRSFAKESCSVPALVKVILPREELGEC